MTNPPADSPAAPSKAVDTDDPVFRYLIEWQGPDGVWHEAQDGRVPHEATPSLLRVRGQRRSGALTEPSVIPFSAASQPFQQPDYPLHTSQDFDALERAASDGRTGRHWRDRPEDDARLHEIPGLGYLVRLSLTPEEKADGLSLRDLGKLTREQDADGIFALLYVSRLLAPPAPLPPNTYAGGWVDLDDVLDKLGWSPRSTSERQEMRAKVWHYLLFGARACVEGQRSTPYYDRVTKQEIPTVIERPLWMFMGRERPKQPSLFQSLEVPLSVEIVMSREWTRLIQNPSTVQYLPMGETLGAIPPDQPGGAWARVIGLALAGFWRRNPRETMAGTLKPTRRELLTRFTPKKAVPDDILKSTNPRRAIEYWCAALGILSGNDRQFLAREGEALRSAEQIRKTLPRKDWQEQWLNEMVDLRPGSAMEAAVRTCANSLPPKKPRALGSRKPRKKKAQ